MIVTIFFSLLTIVFLFKFKLEEVYKKAHSSIRSDPKHKVDEKKKPATKKRWNKAKLTLDERKQKVADKKAAYIAKLQAEVEA